MGANLDRVQVVKGWVDGAGKTHEKIYEVVWSDPAKRKLAGGKLPAVGDTVDLATATYKNSIGAAAAGRQVQGSEFRSQAAGILLRPRARNPDAALDRLRRREIQGEDGAGGADEAAGTRSVVADLV